MTTPLPVFLDTDIASDVDDAMALSVLLGSPEINLIGVSTVYGDTLLRARVAARYSRLAHQHVNVHPGLQTPRSGREVWWAGLEGSLHDNLHEEPVHSTGGVERLVEAAREHAGELAIICIGPLTNIAAAIDLDPAFSSNVKRLHIMGGSFHGTEGPDGTTVEHNFRSDADAAALVFTAGIPATVMSLDFTQTIQFATTDLVQISQAGALGQALTRDIEQWWSYWSQEWNTPHDPLTALTVIEPNLFDLSEPGTVQIDTDLDNDGCSRFTSETAGMIQLVNGGDLDAIRVAVVQRISVAGAATKAGD